MFISSYKRSPGVPTHIPCDGQLLELHRKALSSPGVLHFASVGGEGLIPIPSRRIQQVVPVMITICKGKSVQNLSTSIDGVHT